MINLSKWFIETNPGFGMGAGGNAGAKSAEKTEEKKEEKKEVEKSVYDLELAAFDSGKKIALIKEVRTLTNLGLKEAKNLVETAPTILMKNVKKADAEELITKLKGIGA